MAYRECPNHGWLETAEYTVAESGETICPVCEIAVTGYYPEPEGRTRFGGPTHGPRDRWLKAHALYMIRADHLETSETVEDIEERYPDVDVPE